MVGQSFGLFVGHWTLKAFMPYKNKIDTLANDHYDNRMTIMSGSFYKLFCLASLSEPLGEFRSPDIILHTILLIRKNVSKYYFKIFSSAAKME